MKTKIQLLKVNIDGKQINVERSRYTMAKLKDLRAFGYPQLKLTEVEEQLDKILKGEELTVIGMFMKDDIVK